MEENYWPAKRFITMNIETPREIEAFLSLTGERISQDTPLVRATIAADICFIDEMTGWARKIIDNGGGVNAWMVPRNPHDLIIKMEGLNTVRSHESLEKVMQKARDGEDDFCILGIQTGPMSFPNAIDEMIETAKNIAARNSKEIIVQASCRNLLVAGKNEKDQIVSIYGDAIEVMLYINHPYNPDINYLIEQDELLDMVTDQEDYGNGPISLPELPADEMQHMKLNIN